jgi:glycosyltransferase involved in cell wall biosynthesis
VVHDNASEDGTLKWLEENGIKHSYSAQNEGTSGVNHAVAQAKYDLIIDANSDMYFLPGWDLPILKQVQKFKQQKIDKFSISSCLVEPIGANPEYTILYHGHNPETFDDGLKSSLANGDIYRFTFTYRDSYSPEDAFVFQNKEGVFVLAGDTLSYEWSSLETLATLPAQDDFDDDDLDFDML